VLAVGKSLRLSGVLEEELFGSVGYCGGIGIGERLEQLPSKQAYLRMAGQISCIGADVDIIPIPVATVVCGSASRRDCRLHEARLFTLALEIVRDPFGRNDCLLRRSAQGRFACSTLSC
jgi:hypothetical protein